MALNERLRQRRLELNLTLEEVAKLINVCKPTIQRYESGAIYNIPYEKVEKLAEVLETTPSWLLGWEDTTEEREIINKYNQLDDLGKHAINVVLNMEIERCNNEN